MTKKQRVVRLPRSIKRFYPQVERAIDADESIEVSVSKKDCTDGQKLNPTECALARAAKRELHVDAVIIGMSTSYVIKGKTAVRFQTPNSVQRELVSFDRNQDFAPGDYYLTPKTPTNKFGVNKNNKSGKNKDAKRKHHQSARVRILDKGSE